MRKLIITILIGTALASCSKNGNGPKPTTQNTQQVVKITDSVTIGSQVWTSVNYNGPGGVNYGNGSTNNPTWGKLYTNAEAKALILPNGWRLPTTDDFIKLLKTEGATLTDNDGYIYGGQDQTVKLMSTTMWINNIGINSSGFNAFPAGYVDSDGGNNFHNAAGYSSNYLTAAFVTTSAFTGPGGGTANFVIYQDTQTAPALTQAIITSLNPTGSQLAGRASIRLVRDN